MNKQKTKTGRGIEWTDYTWNLVAGCYHGCQWEMPDGRMANCYAEDTAEGVASAAYPHGFEHHYYHPDRLLEPASVKKPSRIFVGSMADVFGHWVPDWQIGNILEVCLKTPQHTFQFLTKNPVRVPQFDIPDNCWIGASMPPTLMWGKRLSKRQQQAMMNTTWNQLQDLHSQDVTTWLSAEPLSFDISYWLSLGGYTIDWIVVGAASNGRTTYQPEPRWVQNALDACDYWQIPVFFKGNLDWEPWREEFPNGQI